MISKIKALGLAFVAVAAMSAITAAGAQASTVHVGNGQVNSSALLGHHETNQKPTLVLTETDGDKATNTCQTGWIESHAQSSTLQEIQATATYAGQCLLFGQASSVKMNGCKYTLTNQSQAGVTYGGGTATVDITGCTNPTTGITLQTGVCQVQIAEQHNLSHVVMHHTANASGIHEITLTGTVTGIKAKQVGAGCPDGNNHVSTNGEFHVSTIIKGFISPVTQQVQEHGHQFQKVQGGSQTHLTVT